MTQPDTRYQNSLKARYAKASKKERDKMLDEYVATTGCHRKYATAVFGGTRQRVKHPIRRPRRRRQGSPVFDQQMALFSIVKVQARYPKWPSFRPTNGSVFA